MLPRVMKALVKEEETTSYHYKEVPVPTPGEGDLLVKVRKVALCGSDISLYQWNEGDSSICLCNAHTKFLMLHYKVWLFVVLTSCLKYIFIITPKLFTIEDQTLKLHNWLKLNYCTNVSYFFSC